MPDLPHRYAKPLVKPTLELTAAEIHPALLTIVSEARAKATAEEALAVVIDLWNDLLALEETTKEKRRRKNSGVDQVLVAGQTMAIKGAITRHLERHAHLTKRR